MRPANHLLGTFAEPPLYPLPVHSEDLNQAPTNEVKIRGYAGTFPARSKRARIPARAGRAGRT